MIDILEAAEDLEEAIEDLKLILEKSKGGGYTYEEVTLKRWVLGPGGVAGNCDDCVENADEGWIEESEFFPAGDEPVDEPPLHPHCECEVEYKDTRQRVYD